MDKLSYRGILASLGLTLFLGIASYNALQEKVIAPIRVDAIEKLTMDEAHKTYLWVEGLADADLMQTIKRLPQPMCYARTRGELYYFLFDSAYWKSKQ